MCWSPAIPVLTISPMSRTAPAVGETARLYELPDTVTYGGCGTNVGVALARLGFRIGAAVVLGDDLYGMDYSRHLAALGIDTANIIALRGHKTSRSYLFLNPDGQYQNFFFPGAADSWSGRTGTKGRRDLLLCAGHGRPVRLQPPVCRAGPRGERAADLVAEVGYCRLSAGYGGRLSRGPARLSS